MTANNNILILIILINSAIGYIIKFSNPSRSQNRQFFYLSTALTGWMLCVLGIMNAGSSATADILIRLATVASAVLPFQLAMLLQSICHPTLTTFKLWKKYKLAAIIGLFVSVICMTNLFMDGVIMPSPDTPEVRVPEAQYNVGFFIFTAYFFLTLIYALISAVKASIHSTGLMKLELQYVLLGGGVMLISGFVISLVLPWLTQSTQVQQYGPVSVIAMNFIIAYGIATRRILDVGTVIRKLVAYTLLTVYLIFVYMLVWSTSKFILFNNLPNSSFIAHLVAALSVAFSMAPAHGKLQNFADKMISTHTMDVPALMKKAGEIIQSVNTFDALILQFSDLLKIELGSSDVRILLAFDSGYAQQHPAMKPSSRALVSTESAIIKMIRRTKEPVSHDSLLRTRPTQFTRDVIAELRELQTSLAVGFSSKTGLSGVVLFESRWGGRIYDKIEQDALQILCNQFAVALDNAQMYTEMQDSKIRNDILLDQLVSGVLVASPERKITLINHEAQRITGLKEGQSIGQHIDVLPKPISQALEAALVTQIGVRNVAATLLSEEAEEESVAIRMGSAFLLGHDDKPMGALLVFTDMTELKKLEEQVRRSDQLSSVGTLAAGMAHEIKNPLVTIKTFTQLLPSRYQDDDFRNDFATLVAHEVTRIDGIVNQLLSFSKPSQPHLVPMKLHTTVEQTLKLIHEQLAQKNIELKTSFRAENDLISGDPDLLTQALVNLNLNAIDAIGDSGIITVGSTTSTYHFVQGVDPENVKSVPCIRLHISDNGKGIPKNHLQKIFDPFFTSKSEGTGMGLSVAHGIIREHHGSIEVESEEGRGTTFYIYIPLLEEDAVI